jgi:hypothetical protein
VVGRGAEPFRYGLSVGAAPRIGLQPHPVDRPASSQFQCPSDPPQASVIPLPGLPHSQTAVGSHEPTETRSPLILTEVLLPFTIHPLPGGNGVSKLRFLDRRMTPHLHTRWGPSMYWVDRGVQRTGGFLAFSRSIVVAAFATLLQASGRIRLGIFEMLCLLIRTFARVLIGMRNGFFSIVGSERLAGYWQSHEDTLSSPNRGRLSRWRGWKLHCVLATGAVVGTFGCGWALLTLHSVLHHKEVEASDRAALDAIVKRIVDVESDGSQN